MSPPPPFEPPPAPTSLAARLLNVFATPGAVFAEVATSPVALWNWLVPALLAGVVAAISASFFFSEPAVRQRLLEQPEAALRQNLESGQISPAEAEAARQALERFLSPRVITVVGAAGALAWSLTGTFLWAFALGLLAAKLFGVKIHYLKAVEVTSLAGMISVLHEVVMLVMRANVQINDLPGLGPGSAGTEGSIAGRPWLALLDLFVIWQLIVLSIGYGRLIHVPLRRVLLVLTAGWLAVRFGLILVSLLWSRMLA